MEDYKKKYEQALARAREIHRNEDEKRFDMEWLFPELKDSEDERIRKGILELVRQSSEVLDKQNQNNMIAWLEKQGQEPRKVSIWKHWKDGIAGNGEGELIYLIKVGNTYNLSSCLGFECDYIELSELDNLMLEKQSSSSIKWQKNTPENKPPKNHSVLMKTVDGIAEGEWDGKYWHQYRWSTHIYDSNVLYWIELHDLDEQSEQKPFDYKNATITQKDFACDAEEASYTAEVATGDGSIKTVVSKKVSLPNPQSKEWSEEDEEMTKELIGGFLSSVSPYRLTHTSKEIVDWLKSIKCRMKGKEE